MSSRFVARQCSLSFNYSRCRFHILDARPDRRDKCEWWPIKYLSSKLAVIDYQPLLVANAPIARIHLSGLLIVYPPVFACQLFTQIRRTVHNTHAARFQTLKFQCSPGVNLHGQLLAASLARPYRPLSGAYRPTSSVSSMLDAAFHSLLNEVQSFAYRTVYGQFCKREKAIVRSPLYVWPF